MARREGRDPKFRSGHLYQLHAYLTNQAAVPGWESVEGMLLYPTNGDSLDQSFTLHGRHRIRIAAIDLAMKWPDIEEKLLSLLASVSEQHSATALTA